ncbi:MAG: sporulation protein YqfD [Clostridia bacterium]|nr:sporulation protein YqfD [Clostridia bacterium]
MFRINTENLKDIFNTANRCNIHILRVRIKDCCAEVKIYTRDEKKMFSSLESIGYTLVCRKGLSALAKKYRHRVGIILGLLLFFAAMYVSPMFIWEINISGTNTLSYDYVCGLLEKEGVYIGAFSPTVDRRDLYINILSKTDDISWITVNFIGSSANVEIVERDCTYASEVNADAANIVAAKDGQIIEADVINGRCLIKKGEVVKKGDILVSGVYDTGKMGTRYVYSDAIVYAAVCDEFVVEVPLENTKNVYIDETVMERTFKMFGKSIIFYKNYSILSSNYDTIGREEKIQLFGMEKLPVSVLTTSALIYTEEPVILTEEEALARARHIFYERLDTETNYADMLSLEESYTVENSVLIYKCVVEAVDDIAQTSEFKIN